MIGKRLPLDAVGAHKGDVVMEHTKRVQLTCHKRGAVRLDYSNDGKERIGVRTWPASVFVECMFFSIKINSLPICDMFWQVTLPTASVDGLWIFVAASMALMVRCYAIAICSKRLIFAVASILSGFLPPVNDLGLYDQRFLAIDPFSTSERRSFNFKRGHLPQVDSWQPWMHWAH